MSKTRFVFSRSTRSDVDDDNHNSSHHETGSLEQRPTTEQVGSIMRAGDCQLLLQVRWSRSHAMFREAQLQRRILRTKPMLTGY